MECWLCAVYNASWRTAFLIRIVSTGGWGINLSLNDLISKIRLGEYSFRNPNEISEEAKDLIAKLLES